MRIVVDGDSVAMVDTQHPEDCWPTMLGEILGAEVEVLAQPESTAEDCSKSIDKVIDKDPDFYVLQIGQWSQNHEEPGELFAAVSDAIHWAQFSGIKVILVEPPTKVSEQYQSILDALGDCGRTFRICGYVPLSQVDLKDCFIPGQTVPCHFNKLGARMVANMVVAAIYRTML